MPRNRGVKLDPDAYLVESDDRPVNFAWPWAIDRRLDAMLEAVARKRRTSRRELVAAIVLTTPSDPEHLCDIIDTYRDSTVRDAVPEEDVDSSNVVMLRSHPPGPRTDRGSR